MLPNQIFALTRVAYQAVCAITVLSFSLMLTTTLLYGKTHLAVTQQSLSGDAGNVLGVARPEPKASWSSFRDITQVFVFGDSWSSNGLKPCAQYGPNEAPHPFGTPDYPGQTSTNGPNWIGFLTNVYNHTVVKTYNHAIAGSVVSSKTFPGFDLWDLDYQVRDAIEPNRCPLTLAPRHWNPRTSLFSVHFGINDVLGCFSDPVNCKLENPPWRDVFLEYENGIKKLYMAGARNFLLLNCGPVNSTTIPMTMNPSFAAQADPRERKVIEAITKFNKQHEKLVYRLRDQFKDATIFSFDVWMLFEIFYRGFDMGVPETANYKDTTTYCAGYNFTRIYGPGEPNDAELQLCKGLRPEHYLWNGIAHTTWPMHKTIAKHVADLLDSVVNNT